MIAVCGSGSWGTALAATLARNTTDEVWLWGRDEAQLREITAQHSNEAYLPGIKLPNNLIGNANLSEVLQRANDILLVVPSKAFSIVLKQLKPFWTAQHRLVWATKGLDAQTGRFLHELVLEEFGPQQKFAILSGPSFAQEVAKQLPTAVTIATKDEQFGQDLVKYFHNNNFRVYLSADIIGVQVGGVIKNILAVAAGVSDGLGFGANARAALITRGLVEMMRFGLAFGATRETLEGLAGVGDVILSCTDNQSRNRRFGLALAAGKSVAQAQAEIGQIVEAAHNAAQVSKLAAQHNIEMPIAEQVHQLLSGATTPQQAVQNLLSRKPSYEW